MPHFTLQLTLAGPLVDIIIGVSAARVAALTAAGQPAPMPVMLRGLVDTGASCTCVDPAALGSLGLTPTGITSVLTPSTGATPHQANTYDVSLIVPCGTMPPLVIQNLAITESNLAAQGIQALIGRDVLSRCLFIYNAQSATFALAY